MLDRWKNRNIVNDVTQRTDRETQNRQSGAESDKSVMPITKLVDQMERLSKMRGLSRKIRTSLQNGSMVYAILRDSYQATTHDQAMQILERGKVDPDTVQDWLAKPIEVHPYVYSSIRQGYPQLRSDVDKATNRKRVLPITRLRHVLFP